MRLAERKRLRNLVRSMEWVYWPVGAVIALGVVALAWPISHRWLPPSHVVPPTEVQRAIVLMGASLAMQWPYTLYEGGLMGLHRQVLLSSISAAGSSVRGIGSVALLYHYPTVRAFFSWQAAAFGIQTLAVAGALWLCLPRAPERARFERTALKSIRRFASGMMMVTALGFVLTQMDKFVLSRQLPMKLYACYTLAFSAAGGLYFLISPLYSAYFPHFVQAACEGRQALGKLYHQACQVSAALILPAAAVMAINSDGVMRVWSGNLAASNYTSELLRLLTIGIALFCLMHMAMGVLLALGETRVLIRHCSVSVCLAIPAMLYAVHCSGAVGAAWIWIGINAGYILFMVPAMHRRVLPAELSAWAITDLGAPAIVAVLSVAALHTFAPTHENNRPLAGAVLFIEWAVTAAICSLCLPEVRCRLRSLWPA